MAGLLSTLFDPSAPQHRDPADDFWYGPVGAPTAAGVYVSPEAALRVSAVYACINVIAQTIATLPIKMYSRRPNGDKREERAHPLYDLLHDQPNREQSAYQFKYQIGAHLTAQGNAVCEIIPGPRGFADQLRPIHPDNAHPRRLESGRVQWRITENGRQRILMEDEIWHIPGTPFLSPDGVKALSPLDIERQAVGDAIAARDYSARFWSNDGTPPTYIEHPTHFKDAESKRNFLRAWRNAQGGRNRHNTAVLEHGMKLHHIGITNDQAQFLETRKYQDVDIARIYRVPPHKIGILDRATFCLPADTPVFTESGPKPIESVTAGENVWSYDGREMVLSPVKAAACSGVDDILRINARGAALRCSAGHRVLIRRQALMPFNGGRGQCVVSDGRRWRREWEEIYVRADEVLSGDYLVAPVGVPIEGEARCPTRDDISEQFCEILGHHLGDGFLLSGRSGPSGFGFSHGIDESTRDYYAAIIESEFGQRQDYYNRESVTSAAVVTKQRDENTTVVYQSAAARELVECGVAGTAHEKRLPQWVFRLPRQHRLAFIRGFLDSDGHVNANGQAALCSVSRWLIEDFKHLAISCGLRVSRVTRSTTNNTFGENLHTCYKFSITKPEDVAEIGSHKKWYQDRAEGAVARRRDRTVAIYPHERQRRGLDNDAVRYLKVIAVDLDGREPVYDLSVADTQSFVADGVIVHNSNIEQQSIEFVVDTVAPWLVCIEQAIKKDLILGRQFFAEFNVNALLRGDILSRYRAYAIGRNWGWLSANDVLRMENQNSIGPEGDEYLRPGNMMPADSPAEPSGQGAPPPSQEGRQSFRLAETEQQEHDL